MTDPVIVIIFGWVVLTCGQALRHMRLERRVRHLERLLAPPRSAGPYREAANPACDDPTCPSNDGGPLARMHREWHLQIQSLANRKS